MGKKRLVIDLRDVDYSELARKAKEAELTISNFVRRAVGLPLERQGVRREDIPFKTPARKRTAAKGDQT
jgi:hypothetical protein